MANQQWTPDRTEVARLAYVYWEERGCIHGCDEDDWYRAEQEIRRQRGEPTPGPRPDRTVVGVFHSLENAQKACEQLRNEGYSQDEISVIANQTGADISGGKAMEAAVPQPTSASSEIATDAGIGAALGGVGGLLLGFAALAVPGVGPVLAAGPIIAALGGAGVGAAAGGLIGALTERGVPEQDARYYAEGIRRGDILVTVHASGERADRASEMMDAEGAVNINDRVSAWRKRGWTDHDPSAAPLTAAELRREREYYSAAQTQANEWSRQAKGGGKRGSANVKGGSSTPAPDARKEKERSSRIYQQV
jgi:hypothetical protein